MLPTPADLAEVLTSDLGILLGLWALSAALNPDRVYDRALFGIVTAATIATYAFWRVHDTLPAFEPTARSLWPHLFIAFEAVAITYTILSIVILLRRTDHSAEADRAQASLERAGFWPAVDIFICSYNEPIEVVEKSILLALDIDYQHKTVWVLDDTRRGWLREYCEEVGARYLTRADNKGAKAGNLNNALRATSGETNAPIILVLDADFAPQPNILKRTVGLFAEPEIGVVQTPQFFYNADPIQHNLLVADSWVDDQRIFFDVFQPAKDAWGAAFCVGTSFLVRRDRLAEIGGFPDTAICEDLNLTYSLLRRGYVTRWLNERLSVGLSAEGLPEYISQRTRWCLGTIQVALLPSGPLFGSSYTFVQRIHFLHGVLNWLCKPFIVLMLIAPAMYWFGGLPAFEADYISFLRYGLPALLALWAYNGWVSRSRTLPIFMEVTHTVAALAVTLTLASALVRPFGRPFKVTDKGGDRSRLVVRWRLAALFGGMSALSAASIVWGFVSPTVAAEVSPLDYFNLLWAGVALLFTFAALLVCFELPREEERFPVDFSSWIGAGTSFVACHVARLSPRRATVRAVGAGWPLSAEAPCRLLVPDVGWVAASPGKAGGGDLELVLHPDPTEYRSLVRRLFSEPFYHIAPQARMGGALRGLLRRGLLTG